jgi:pectin methylesterase-like acyl-CoA thioesterase
MRKLLLVFALAAGLGLAACTSQPTQTGDSTATAPTTTAPAASCGASCGGGKACG